MENHFYIVYLNIKVIINNSSFLVFMDKKNIKNSSYQFFEPLFEGIILERPNRFLMKVKYKNKQILCHCPVACKIESLILNERPCLISRHQTTKRKHAYTVEAIYLGKNKKNITQWAGINQVKINEFVEFFLKNGSLQKISGNNLSSIKREVKIGNSKFDFLIENRILETKLFLNNLSSDNSIKIDLSKQSYKRFSQQYYDLIMANNQGYTSNILFCYLYKTKKMVSPILSYYPKILTDIVKDAISKNVKHWQLNFKISKNQIKLVSYIRI